VCVFVDGCVDGSVTTIYCACIDPHQTGFVGKGSDHLQLIKFWPSCAPGRGSAAGRKILFPPYYSQRAVFASPLSAFFIFLCYNGCIDVCLTRFHVPCSIFGAGAFSSMKA